MSSDARTSAVNVVNISEFVTGYKAQEQAAIRAGLKGVVQGVAIYAAGRIVRGR